MIFYFSGVGNSYYVARCLAEELHENLYFIPKEITGSMSYKIKKGERLGFVFPCYGWGVPTFMEHFISKLNIEGQIDYLYFVTTCGDDTGMTSEIFCKDVERKGWECKAGWAVIMPESYVCLPGFDVDNNDKESDKLIAARDRINKIIDDILDQRNVFDTIPGPFKWIKSNIVRPFFNKYLINPRHFKTNKSCIGCGKCVNACPYSNISLDNDSLPKWGDNCVQCLRCYHICPQKAIEWGVFTAKKGQYTKMIVKNLLSQHLS